MISINFLLAQTKSKQIKGKVTDESGVGLEGASVKLIGTIRGVQSDNAGNFTIPVPTDGEKYEISISFIGYASQTVPATDNGTIKLQKQIGTSEDVVVIGYGTTKRKDLTGTVSSISGAELSKIPFSSAAEAITGRMPGVQVTTVDGQLPFLCFHVSLYSNAGRSGNYSRWPTRCGNRYPGSWWWFCYTG